MHRHQNEFFLWVRLMALLSLIASPLCAQQADSYKTKPAGHEQNKKRAAEIFEQNRKKYADQTNILVRPGLVADRKNRRVEVLVERTGVGQNAPCEFLVLDESSDHAYEALLLSFAKPSEVHRALEFIGTKPGEPFDPESLRFWAKGETFMIGIARSNEPPLRIEKLLLDQRNGKALREDGFMFTGSKTLLVTENPAQKFYAADEYQPKAIVSLFNSTFTVLDVPYSAAKEAVYQNTIVNPEHELAEGSLLTLVIKAAAKDGTKRVKDLLLQVSAINTQTNKPATDTERLERLSFELKGAETVLNKKPGLISMIESLARLDRKKHDYYLQVRFAPNVELGQAQALAKILSSMDNERGVRIEPPDPGQLYYMSFTPDNELLDRETRMFHPWELSLAEKDGQVMGRLLLVESVWKKGSSISELEFSEFTVSNPQDLIKEFKAEAGRAKKSEKRAKPAVIMVFAPPTLKHGQLMKFLEPVLPTHQTVYVYLNEPMPPIPAKQSTP